MLFYGCYVSQLVLLYLCSELFAVGVPVTDALIVSTCFLGGYDLCICKNFFYKHQIAVYCLFLKQH